MTTHELQQLPPDEFFEEVAERFNQLCNRARCNAESRQAAHQYRVAGLNGSANNLYDYVAKREAAELRYRRMIKKQIHVYLLTL